MKKLVFSAALIAAMILGTVSVNAQTPQAPAKKECCKTEKKEQTATKKEAKKECCKTKCEKKTETPAAKKSEKK